MAVDGISPPPCPAGFSSVPQNALYGKWMIELR
jgi:hypothetical protein